MMAAEECWKIKATLGAMSLLSCARPPMSKRKFSREEKLKNVWVD